uniref:Uncharacterized protein n=1 Tax=Anopheles epiroticus TaxID=199890 RepID=A0A182PCY7_9DIPT
MRSRTELVTNTLDGSDFDEETDFEDSEEDWKPDKGDPKAMKRKTRDILTGTLSAKRGGRGNGSKRGRKPGGKGRGTPRKRFFEDDEDDDDDDDDEEDEEDSRFDSEASGTSTPPVPKRGRKSSSGTPHGRKSNSSSSSSSKTSPSTSKSGNVKRNRYSDAELKGKPIQRKVGNTPGSVPDKSGYLKLYVCRADLEEGIRNNLKVCLWRRDGSSLLQKYFRDKSVDASTPQYTSSMVYSCWEDRRADEYMEVKVRCIEHAKQLRVQIMDVEAIECRAREEYQKYIEKYGKVSSGGSSSERLNGENMTGSGSSARKTHDSEGEEEYEEAEEPNDELEEGERSDVPSQEE